MADALLVKPDTRFIRDVMASGGEDLKKCYQCATCSVVCKLAPDDAPFPRRQMLHAQWGLKDRLMADPAVWLCHNCRDCTEQCPRGARPGDVLGAIRSQVIRRFAFPSFMGKLSASPAALPILLLLPIVIFATIAALAGQPEAGRPLEFADWFPIGVLEPLFFAVSGLVLLAFAVGLVRFVHALRAAGVPPLTVAALAGALLEIARHDRFAECEHPTARRWGHLLTFWGFMGLAFMGTVVGIGTMAGVMHTPLAVMSPWKLFANAVRGGGACRYAAAARRAGARSRRARAQHLLRLAVPAHAGRGRDYRNLSRAPAPRAGGLGHVRRVFRAPRAHLQPVPVRPVHQVRAHGVQDGGNGGHGSAAVSEATPKQEECPMAEKTKQDRAPRRAGEGPVAELRQGDQEGGRNEPGL